jgi:hypothetical protein
MFGWINPTMKQELIWNTDDLNDPQIPDIFSEIIAGYGNDDRLESANRIKVVASWWVTTSGTLTTG